MEAIAKVYPKPGIDLIEVPEPTIKEDDEVLLQVMGCGLCGSDIHFYNWEENARWLTLPRVLGHEVSGTVVAAGKAITQWKAGDNVVSDTWGGCGYCHFCRSGQFNFCLNKVRIGFEKDGGMAKYVVVKEHCLLPLPQVFTPVQGAILEPFGVAVRAFERSKLGPGQNVLVIGPGPVGLMVALIAAKYGTSVNLAGLHQDTARLSIAEELGINCEFFESLTLDLSGDQYGFDLVFEVSGASAAIDRALDLLRPSGELIAIGIGDPSVLDWNKIVRKEVTVKGVYRRNPSTWFRAGKLLQELGPRIKNIGTIYPLKNAVDAFEDAKNRRVMKVVIAP